MRNESGNSFARYTGRHAPREFPAPRRVARASPFRTSWLDHTPTMASAKGIVAAPAGSRPGPGRAQGNLGPRGRNTAILVSTDFGRTASINARRSTDHGTGAASLFVRRRGVGRRACWRAGPGWRASACTRIGIVRPTGTSRRQRVCTIHLGVADCRARFPGLPESAAIRPLWIDAPFLAGNPPSNLRANRFSRAPVGPRQ